MFEKYFSQANIGGEGGGGLGWGGLKQWDGEHGNHQAELMEETHITLKWPSFIYT